MSHSTVSFGSTQDRSGQAEGWVRHRLGTFSLDVGWSVAPGEVLSLFGPSGSGKSTTLRAIAGLLRPLEGCIVVGSRPVFDSARSVWLPPHLRRVGYMPQQYGLFPHLVVRRNVAFGLSGWGGAEAAQRVEELLTLLHIDELAERYPAQLSAGQQQRVALARALAPRPEMLLLDEPFSALDQELRRELRKELRAVTQRADIPVVVVTHDWADVLSLSDKVLVLDRGRIVSEGPPLEVMERPSAEVLSRLTEVENVLGGQVTALDQAAGVMTCDLDGVVLEVPFVAMEAGSRVRVGVRAGDILLAIEPPRGLSARNVLQGRVLSLERRGFEMEAVVDSGRRFRVELTPRAVESLGIAPGRAVWLVIKSNSCFLIE